MYPQYVWMIEESVRAELLSFGAYASLVRYNLQGNTYEVMVGNDEFEHIGKEYDDDED